MPADAALPVETLLRTLAFISLTLFSPVLSAQQAGGVALSGSQVHLVRAVVGVKGETRNGTFIMTEPRSTFYVPDDKELIVYFEWEGAKGTHHCEGNVHGPHGEFATMSSFDYVATQPRFAGFWKLPLSESTPEGSWIFESKVDGEAAGQVSFQVVLAAKPAGIGVIAAAAPLPTRSEIYAHAVAATIDIEQIDAQGHSLHHRSGFLLKDGEVVTSFRAIDGASNLRLRSADGSEFPSPLVAAWNRHQDWAVLTTNTKGVAALKKADPRVWKIGDACYWLDVNSDGNRILSDGQIVGMKSSASSGDRVDFSGSYNSGALGGALLNERGEVIGILGGATPESFLGVLAPQVQPDSELALYSGGGIAIETSVLPTSLPGSPVALQDLWAKGLMVPPVTGANYVLFGMLTQGGKSLDKKSPPVGRDFKSTFQRGDSSANALIHFTNTSNFKATAVLKLYDMDNRLVASSPPAKVNVARGEIYERVWQLPLANLPAGIYRVDLEIADGVAWRQYFKLQD
jgi:hypothetical protein